MLTAASCRLRSAWLGSIMVLWPMKALAAP
jgi:hypothetical protein